MQRLLRWLTSLMFALAMTACGGGGGGAPQNPGLLAGDPASAALAAFTDNSPEPAARRTYSRFDLNGDGFTGGNRTTRMDLDPAGSTRFGAPQLDTLNGQIGGVAVTYDERAITDARACIDSSAG